MIRRSPLVERYRIRGGRPTTNGAQGNLPGPDGMPEQRQ